MSAKRMITFFGKPAFVDCDRRCDKAWGINQRPEVRFDDEDDTAYLADGELGVAPVDPGTYEGADSKPLSPDHFPNKWCVRECERCTLVRPGEPLVIKDFSQRRYNQPWKHPTPHAGEGR